MRITIVANDPAFISLWTLANTGNAHVDRTLVFDSPVRAAEQSRPADSTEELVVFHASTQTMELWRAYASSHEVAAMLAIFTPDLNAEQRQQIGSWATMTLEYGDLSIDQIQRTVSQLRNDLRLNDGRLKLERELTELRRWQAHHLDRQDSLMQELSHCLRTPLTVVREFSDALLVETAGPITQRQRECLDTIRYRTDDIQRVVDNLLDLHRLETGAFRTDRRNFSVESMLQELASQVEPRTRARGIVLDVDLAASLPEIYCDREEIQRVLVQLATNAINRMDKEGTLRIYARFEQDSSRVVIGISDSVLTDTHIASRLELDPIQDQMAAIGSETIGLSGLDLMEQIVKVNLGTIDVSQFSTAGTTIRISLPIKDPSILLHQFLEMIQYEANESTLLELCSIELDADHLPSAHGLGGLLHSELSCFDFAFPISQRRWIVLLKSHAHLSISASEKLAGSWEKMMHSGALPLDIRMRCESLGRYNLARERVGIFAHFTAACCNEPITRLSPTRVLVVDDSPEAVRQCTDRLDALGYQVTKVREGLEGITTMMREVPDAIVVDVRQSDGRQLDELCDLKQPIDDDRIAIVILSASIRDQQKAIEQHLLLTAPTKDVECGSL